MKTKQSNKKSSIEIIKAQAFFHELLSKAFKKVNVKTNPSTEVYLVNMLSHFITIDNFYARKENGKIKEEPLALMTKEALEESNLEGKKAIFRYIGDVSLYSVGFFQESLLRKNIDINYYITMGENAYTSVANNTECNQAETFWELSKKFERLVDVLAEVSDQTTPKSEENLLRIYKLWINTGNNRAEKKLKKELIKLDVDLKKKLN